MPKVFPGFRDGVFAIRFGLVRSRHEQQGPTRGCASGGRGRGSRWSASISVTFPHDVSQFITWPRGRGPNSYQRGKRFKKKCRGTYHPLLPRRCLQGGILIWAAASGTWAGWDFPLQNIVIPLRGPIIPRRFASAFARKSWRPSLPCFLPTGKNFRHGHGQN